MSKIRKVVLYKHGVGYFERKATVEGNAEVRLGFRAEEMNDVLKSLTVFDSGGGTVNSVSYDNQKPLSKLLEEISLDIPATGGAAAMLSVVRGARVEVTGRSRKVAGQVVGIEERLSRHDGATSQRKILSVFDESGSLHSFDLEDVIHVNFLDEHLRKDLHFLLETLLSATKSDTKNLKLFARGEGERELAISYVVECPIWKTSYRMALPVDPQEKPYLQGWALVDNPQDEDWQDVDLSLVSGLPISFTHDLYSPRYLKRKEIEVERESAAGPVMAEEALFQDSGALEFEAGSADLFGGGLFAEAAPLAAAAPGAAQVRSRSRQMAASQKTETVTQKVGQLFEYRINHPVTVLRNQSALVPIVGDAFEGKRKLFYNEKERAENPFAVIDFKNTTGLTLEGGPLTVYEGEVYAGEAMMDTIGPDEERMLPYAVELAVTVKVERDSNQVLMAQTLSKGVWEQTMANYKTTRYRFNHKGKQAKELVLEHPLSDAKLVKTPEPLSETRSFWRFSMDLQAGQETEFVVTEKTEHGNRLVLRDFDPQRVLMLISATEDLPAMQESLAKLRALTTEICGLLEKESEFEKTIKSVGQDQKRLRENLSSLGQSDDENRLRSRYVKELESQEDKLKSVHESLIKTKQARETKEQQFYDVVGSLSLERLFEDGD